MARHSGETLHRWLQIAGKIKLAKTPLVNHLLERRVPHHRPRPDDRRDSPRIRRLSDGFRLRGARAVDRHERGGVANDPASARIRGGLRAGGHGGAFLSRDRRPDLEHAGRDPEPGSVRGGPGTCLLRPGCRREAALHPALLPARLREVPRRVHRQVEPGPLLLGSFDIASRFSGRRAPRETGRGLDHPRGLLARSLERRLLAGKRRLSGSRRSTPTRRPPLRDRRRPRPRPAWPPFPLSSVSGPPGPSLVPLRRAPERARPGGAGRARPRLLVWFLGPAPPPLHLPPPPGKRLAVRDALALHRPVPRRPDGAADRRAGPAERLLHRRQQRRRLEDDRLRPHLDADLRRPADRLDRRARGRAVRSQRHLRRQRRGPAAARPLRRRRHVQVHRRRQDLAAPRPARRPADRAILVDPKRPEPRLRRRPRPSLRAERRARRLPLDGWRRDLGEGALQGREHRRPSRSRSIRKTRRSSTPISGRRARRRGRTAPSTGPGSGLFKSTDGGTTWKPLETGLPTIAQGLGRIGIAVAPSDPKRLYAQSSRRRARRHFTAPTTPARAGGASTPSRASGDAAATSPR